MTYSSNDIWGLDSDLPTAETKNNIPAFFNLEDVNDDDEVKKWLDNAISVLEGQMSDYARKSVENLMFYKGMQNEQSPHYLTIDEAQRFYKHNKISLNIVYEFVELQVNRLSQFKAEVGVKPSTNDTDARDSAEAKQIAIQDYIEKNNINHKLDIYSRECFTFGESFFHVWWDYDKGELHPDFVKLNTKFKGLQRVSTASGEDVNIDRMPRIGDVVVDIVPSIYVLYEERPWEHVEYVILNIKTNVDKLRSDYPDADIKGSGDIDCYWMYHLPTKYLQKGRWVKYAGGAVLENTIFPLSKPILPVVKMTDIDIIGSSRGKSFVENIKPHQVLINESVSTTWDNLRRAAKGKWVMPAKTTNPKHLAPQSPGIEYYGAVPPKYVPYSGINPESIRFIELLREYAEKQARIHGVTQGTPPANVRSGLQFAQLEEQQRKSVEIMVNKRNRAIEELCEVIIAFMSRYYKDTDGRTVTTFGRDKEYLTKSLRLDALKEDSRVKVENNDALPSGKISQMAFFSDIRQQFGNQVVPDEMMIDMLDSGRFNQYTEFGGATVETTLGQISAILNGDDYGDVHEYEDLPLKWKLVVGHMRKRTFMTYPKEVKAQFKEMLLTIETLIMEKDTPSPIFQEQVATLSGFPVYWRAPINTYPETAAPVEEPSPNGAAPTEADVPVV